MRPLPAPILRLLRHRLSPRLFDSVAGDLEEQWRRDAARSRARAWINICALAASVLWHSALERRRQRPAGARGDGMFTGLLQDLRFAWRLGLRQPWLSAAAVLTLALGIGATTAIFSVVHAWLLTALPYTDPHRLVVVWETIPSAGILENTPAPVSLSAWKARARSFERLAAWTSGGASLTGAGEPAQLAVARVLPDLLPLLGVSPILGRNFTTEEAQPNGPAAVLITQGLWTTRFGARRDVIGQRISLSGVPTAIVGVLPDGALPLHFAADIWQPLRFDEADWASENRMLWVVGRLADGVSADRASRDVEALMRERSDGSLGARVVPLHEQTLGPLGRDVLVLFGATALVLFIACANVASITLARITGRRQELVVRTALGASRRRIVRQILTESLALGLAGGVAGLLLAAWAVRAVVVLAPPAARMPDVTVASPAVCLFAAGLATLTAAAFGIIPAWRSGGLPLARAIREDSHSIAGGRLWLLRGMVAAEVALAFALLAGAALVVRSYQNLSLVELGFDPSGVVAFEVSRPSTATPGASLAFYQELLLRIGEAPGIRSAALTQALPLRSSGFGSNFHVEGRSGDDPSILAYWRVVSRDLFETLSIPVLRGRSFDAGDRQGAERVAIVSESFARRAWPDGDAIGRRIGWGSLDLPLTVVGVAGDIRLSPAAAPGPHVYLPFLQTPESLPRELVVRSEAGVAMVIDIVRRTVRAIDPAQPIAGIMPMDALKARTMDRRRFHLAVFSIAAAIALSLALVGIYGLLSYAGGQMATELGLRAALGASRGGLIWLVMRLGLVPAAAGLGVGAGLAWWSAGILRGFVFGLQPRDPLTLAAAALLLSIAAAAACLVPAWRAALANPLTTMRAR